MGHGAGGPVLLFPTTTVGSIYGDVAEREPWSASHALRRRRRRCRRRRRRRRRRAAAKVSAVAQPPERTAPRSIVSQSPIMHGQFPSPLYPRNARRSTLYLFTYRNISRTRRPAQPCSRSSSLPLSDPGFRFCCFARVFGDEPRTAQVRIPVLWRDRVRGREDGRNGDE